MALNERERAFENKFAHQQEVDFKIRAKAVSHMARWVSDIMAYSVEQSEIYQDYAMQSVLQDHNESSFLGSIMAMLQGAGHELSQHELEHYYALSLQKAHSDIYA